jgi:hypothetical protein
MSLDVNTLFLITIYVEAMLGLLLLFAWVQNSAITAVAWWGSAHLLRASSVVLFGMYGTAPEWITIDLSNAILFTAFAVTWTGARVFDGRPPSIIGLFGGAVLWLAICRIPVIAHSLEARILISSFIITGYTWMAAYEFWRGRSEPLVSRWPAIFMLFAHGALFLLRTPLFKPFAWHVFFGRGSFPDLDLLPTARRAGSRSCRCRAGRPPTGCPGQAPQRCQVLRRTHLDRLRWATEHTACQ